MVRRSFGIASFVLAAGLAFGVTSAHAEANAVQKACSAEWKAAKDANKVPAGQKWPAFYSECAKTHAAAAPAAAAPAAAAPAAPAAAAPAAPAPAAPVSTKAVPPEPGTPAAAAPAATTAAGKPLTAGQIAAHERIKKCGAEWTATKEAGKIPAGQKWPQFWSACNKRLKAAGQ